MGNQQNCQEAMLNLFYKVHISYSCTWRVLRLSLIYQKYGSWYVNVLPNDSPFLWRWSLIPK